MRSLLLDGNQNKAATSGEASGTEDEEEEEEFEDDNEDGVREEAPLLPIFSAAHLGSGVHDQVSCHRNLTDTHDRCLAHI